MNTLADETEKKKPDADDMIALERVFSMDPLIVRRYLIEERAHLDYVANMKESREEGIEVGIEKGIEKGIKKGRKEGREEGRKEGREEGRKEGREDSARRLRSQGVMSDEQIANILDIPLETVKTL